MLTTHICSCTGNNTGGMKPEVYVYQYKSNFRFTMAVSSKKLDNFVHVVVTRMLDSMKAKRLLFTCYL